MVLDWVRARIGRAKYLLLDEPAAGGDEALVSLLLDLLSAAREAGCGVLLVEHRDGLLRSACDRIVYLHNGVCADAPNGNGYGSLARSTLQTRHLDPNPTVSAARLAVQKLSVTRGGALVLKGISFHAYAGEVVVLTGANGSGKSTLLRAIYGDPSCSLADGCITSERRNLSELKFRQRLASGVHLMPQDGMLFPSMTVEESLCSSVEAVNLNGWDANTVKNLRRKLPLLDKIWLRKCGLLSGGERRLVLLSRVVLLKPAVALLDEPLAGVDVNTREQVVGLIRELAQGGAAVIIAEQEALTHLIPAERFLCLSGSKQCSMAAASG